jgi:enamine deaminase RidA (YjgF/YER057c/UK114 family)
MPNPELVQEPPVGVRVVDSGELVVPKGHYSHVAIHGDTAYVSGQLPLDLDGRPLADADFAVQVRTTLANLDSCLAAAGTDRSRLLSVTVYISDIGLWPEFDGIYASWIGTHRPARAVAAVSVLHYGAAVEVQAVAAIPRRP